MTLPGADEMNTEQLEYLEYIYSCVSWDGEASEMVAEETNRWENETVPEETKKPSVPPPTKKEKASKAPKKAGPKKAASAWNFYTSHVLAFDPDCQAADRSQMLKLAGAKWKALSAADKAPFEQQAKVDKARYAAERASHEAGEAGAPNDALHLTPIHASTADKMKPIKKSAPEVGADAAVAPSQWTALGDDVKDDADEKVEYADGDDFRMPVVRAGMITHYRPCTATHQPPTDSIR